MKHTIQAACLAALLCAAVPSFAADNSMSDMPGMQQMSKTTDDNPAADAMSSGVVKKVDKSAGKLTIKHGPLTNLGMGAMTMVFRAEEPAMLDEVKPGDRIDFVAADPNGQLTVIKLQIKR